jgi:amidase
MSETNVQLKWDALIAAKRAANLAKIPIAWRLSAQILETINENATIGVLDVPRSCGILSPSELELTENWDATDLIDMMKNRAVNSEDVVLAFCKRAAIAQQLVSSLP